MSARDLSPIVPPNAHDLPESVYVVSVELLVLNLIWLAYFLLKTGENFTALWLQVIFYSFLVVSALVIAAVVARKIRDRVRTIDTMETPPYLFMCAQTSAVYLLVLLLLFVVLNILLLQETVNPAGSETWLHTSGWRLWLNGIMFAPGYEYVEADWVVALQVLLISVLGFFGVCGVVFCVLSTGHATPWPEAGFGTTSRVDWGLGLRQNVFLTVVAVDGWNRLLIRACGHEACVYDAADRPFAPDDTHMFEIVAWLLFFFFCDASVVRMQDTLRHFVAERVLEVLEVSGAADKKSNGTALSSPHWQSAESGAGSHDRTQSSNGRSGKNVRLRLSRRSALQTNLAGAGRAGARHPAHAHLSGRLSDLSLAGGAYTRQWFAHLLEIDVQLAGQARRSVMLILGLRVVHVCALLCFCFVYSSLLLGLIRSYVIIAVLVAIFGTGIVDLHCVAACLQLPVRRSRDTVTSAVDANATDALHAHIRGNSSRMLARHEIDFLPTLPEMEPTRAVDMLQGQPEQFFMEQFRDELHPRKKSV